MKAGGEVRPVTDLDAAREETGHCWPDSLPDGKHFLFVALPPKEGNFDVFVGSIDSKERKFLFAASSAAIYAEPGYLIYMRDNTMVAHRFDLGRVATIGEPVSLGQAPAPSSWTGGAVVSASNNGAGTLDHDRSELARTSRALSPRFNSAAFARMIYEDFDVQARPAGK